MHESATKRHPMIDMEEFERRLRQSSGNQTIDDSLAELAGLIGGQQDLIQKIAEPQGQSSTEARQVARPSSEALEPEAQQPDPLQSSGDANMACQDSGNVNEGLASGSLYFMITAATVIVGLVGIGASVGYRNGASPPSEIATVSENGLAKPQLEKQTARKSRPRIPPFSARRLNHRQGRFSITLSYRWAHCSRRRPCRRQELRHRPSKLKRA
jgi:hypothetical protein